MAIVSSIEYVDSSSNLQMGCAGCELWNPKQNILSCYAGTLTNRYGGRKGWPNRFDEPEIFPHRLAESLRWPDLTGKERPGKPWLNPYPRIIFMNDMGDSFTKCLALDWLTPFIPDMAASPHIRLWLTKRPGRMLKAFELYGSIPQNFWMLTTITRQATVSRLNPLLELAQINPNVMLGVSVEPLLESVMLPDKFLALGGRGWVIVGGESGRNGRAMQPEWAANLQAQCREAGLAFFFKQWGEYAPVETLMGQFMERAGKGKAGRQLMGQEWNEMPRVWR